MNYHKEFIEIEIKLSGLNLEYKEIVKLGKCIFRMINLEILKLYIDNTQIGENGLK